MSHTVVIIPACKKDSHLAPLCLAAIRRVHDGPVLLAADIYCRPVVEESLFDRVIPLNLRTLKGWAGGTVAAFTCAAALFPEARKLVGIDADSLVLKNDWDACEAPARFYVAAGEDRPCGVSGLRPYGTGKLLSRQALDWLILNCPTGDHEDLRIAEALRQMPGSEGIDHDPHGLRGCGDPSLPLSAYQEKGRKLLHLGQFPGDHATRKIARAVMERYLQELLSSSSV